MARRLILIVPDGADTLLSILDQYMKGMRLSSNLFPYDPCSFLSLLIRMG